MAQKIYRSAAPHSRFSSSFSSAFTLQQPPFNYCLHAETAGDDTPHGRRFRRLADNASEAERTLSAGRGSETGRKRGRDPIGVEYLACLILLEERLSCPSLHPGKSSLYLARNLHYPAVDARVPLSCITRFLKELSEGSTLPSLCSSMAVIGSPCAPPTARKSSRVEMFESAMSLTVRSTLTILPILWFAKGRHIGFARKSVQRVSMSKFVARTRVRITQRTSFQVSIAAPFRPSNFSWARREFL